MRGHSSVTQARDTQNLGVVTYYHPVFTNGIRKHWALWLLAGTEFAINGPYNKAKWCT